MPRSDEPVTSVPAGNVDRYVACKCGETVAVPVNVLHLRCPECGAELITTTRPGVMQR